MFSGVALAASVSDIKQINPYQGDLFSLLDHFINIFLGVAGIVAFVYFLYAGFQYLTAGTGDGAENAKKTILNAIIGIIIIALAWVLVNFVINDLLNPNSTFLQSGSTSTAPPVFCDVDTKVCGNGSSRSATSQPSASPTPHATPPKSSASPTSAPSLPTADTTTNTGTSACPEGTTNCPGTTTGSGSGTSCDVELHPEGCNASQTNTQPATSTGGQTTGSDTPANCDFSLDPERGC